MSEQDEMATVGKRWLEQELRQAFRDGCVSEMTHISHEYETVRDFHARLASLPTAPSIETACSVCHGAGQLDAVMVDVIIGPARGEIVVVVCPVCNGGGHLIAAPAPLDAEGGAE